MGTIQKKQAIYWGVSIILAIAGYFLPLGDIYTVEMKKFVAITIFGLCLLAFELGNNWMIAMLMPTAWVISGVTDFATAFGTFGSMNFIMLLNAFLFAAILSKTGLMDRIGYGLILKSGGTYYSGVWALFLVGMVISFVSMMMNFVLVATIALAMFKALEIKPSDKAAVPIFTTIVLTCTHAKVIVYAPISVGIMNSAVQTIIPDYVVTYGELVFYGWPMFIFMLFFEWVVLKWYKNSTKNEAKPIMDGAKNIYKAKYEALGHMTMQEKLSVGALVFLFLWMIMQSLGVHKFDITYAFIIANIFLFLAGIADESCLRNVSIGNVAVVMSFVSVGVVAAALQLTSLISAGVTSLFGSMGDYWATVGTLIFGIVSNFILTPYAMMTMLPTVVISYCIDIGWSWLPHFLSCYMAADLIFFPYEYPTVLIIFGFGMITMKNAIKMLSIKLVLAVIFIIAILMPYWKLLGLYAL